MVLKCDIILFISAVRGAEINISALVLSTLVCSCGPASRGCSRSNIETTASLWQACRFAAVLSLPYLNMSYVSEEEGMVTVHELGDLHPVTLAILMSINVTDKEFTACT